MKDLLINITDITTYLYCPRKLYLKKIKKIKEKVTKSMVVGLLKHKIFDIFNKNEKLIVYKLDKHMNVLDIENLYNDYVKKITYEILNLNKNIIKKFDIDPYQFSNEIGLHMKEEIKLRINTIIDTLRKGFVGKTLWENLNPKFLTEFEIVSEKLGLKGRIDRIEVSNKVIPYEIKTRNEIYTSDKIQLAGYALLLEDKFNTEVDVGIIEINSKKEKINIHPELKKQVLNIAREIREMFKNKKEIPINSNFKKCENCKFKHVCFELN